MVYYPGLYGQPFIFRSRTLAHEITPSVHDFQSESMNRRSLLISAASIGLSHFLTGCSGESSSTLRVKLLSNSIPPQILNKFRKHLEQSSNSAVLKFSPEAQLATLFSQLQMWKQRGEQAGPASPGWVSRLPLIGDRSDIGLPDLVTLGNYWLTKAIQQQLIQPLDVTQLSGWKQFPQDRRWQQLIRRNSQGQPDPNGSIWGVPYRWGSTLIAYRQDIFKRHGLQPITDWGDLWRSDLQGHVSLPDQPREVIGLTLKKLGKSYNTQDLAAVPTLEAELQALHRQVKLYSSDAYQQPLLLGDTWVAVGWSTDLLPLLQRTHQIAAIVPAAGTSLWAELWVRPAAQAAGIPAIVAEWINFCLQPDVAVQLSLLSQAASPVVSPAAARTTLPKSLQQNSLILPSDEILDSSEFLQPLPQSAVNQYLALWKRIRQQTRSS